MPGFEAPLFHIVNVSGSPAPKMDVANHAETLARERPAVFEDVFGGLPVRAEGVRAFQSCIGSLRAFLDMGRPQGALVIGFEAATTLIYLGTEVAPIDQIILRVLDTVTADYVPEGLNDEFVGRAVSMASLDNINGHLHAYERLLISLGAPSAAGMAKRRLGLGF